MKKQSAEGEKLVCGGDGLELNCWQMVKRPALTEVAYEQVQNL